MLIKQIIYWLDTNTNFLFSFNLMTFVSNQNSSDSYLRFDVYGLEYLSRSFTFNLKFSITSLESSHIIHKCNCFLNWHFVSILLE